MGEFDKALQVYEHIVQEEPGNAEAHWCCALCRFGIEYVEDPVTMEYLPTCHRASFDIFTDDIDYLAAVENADGITKKQYQKDAAKITEVQRGILATSQNEKPFDVFLCYKESDESGGRTVDSTLAQDIYYQLTDAGFRVFFSRITLEDKAGSEYEPYIFAALQSAKAMVCVATKAEHLNSVWVKNEWSRFLALMRKDRSKVLLPCYRDMNPYDMPEQLSVLQSYDMGKIGFMQDLIRGIKKITAADEPKPVVKETVVVNAPAASAANVAPLLERVFLFLEDGKWNDANIYCEKVLDADPKNAEAYLGKLMAELQVKNRKQLAGCAKPFDDRDNFSKVIRFGDEALENEIRGYIAYINERNETARKQSIYDSAKLKISNDSKESNKEAIKLFESIIDWKDSRTKIDECIAKIKDIEIAEEKAEAERKRKDEEARIAAEKAKARNKKIAMTVGPIAAVLIVFAILLNTVILPAANYKKALAAADAGNYSEAYSLFNKNPDYKDTEEHIKKIGKSLYNYKFKKVKVGSIIKFGKYYQSNSNNKEEIEWRVLEVKDGKVLIISEKALDCQQYNTEKTDVTWETCSLRKWLNETFINEAFNKGEQTVIAETTVTTAANPIYSTSSGNDTTDKVFLLSIPEANTYFVSPEERTCKPTDYAKEKGAWTNNPSDVWTNVTRGACWWWLRSPGYDSVRVANVYGGGDISNGGNSVNDTGGCVRPAMWIEI